MASHRPAGSSTSPFRYDATSTPRDLLHATPRAGGVSFSSDIHGRDLDPDGTQGVGKSVAEMNTLRCPPPRRVHVRRLGPCAPTQQSALWSRGALAQ